MKRVERLPREDVGGFREAGPGAGGGDAKAPGDRQVAPEGEDAVLLPDPRPGRRRRPASGRGRAGDGEPRGRGSFQTRPRVLRGPRSRGPGVYRSAY